MPKEKVTTSARPDLDYRNEYLKKHPEIRLRYRISENASFLRKHGWTCIPPQSQVTGEEGDR